MLKYIKYFLLIIFALFCVSCIKPSKYEHYIEINDTEKHQITIKKLKEKGIDYRAEGDGKIFFKSKDKNIVLYIAFHSDVPSYKSRIPEETKLWKVSIDDVEAIILKRYPNILKNAIFATPYVTFLESDLEGFALANEKLWHIRIVCEKRNTGLRAVFLIHSVTGKVHVVVDPEGSESAKCPSREMRNLTNQPSGR